MRRLHPGEGAKKPQARYHSEGAAVDATGIWHEGHASYPGRSAVLPCATGVERCWDEAAEVSRGHSSRTNRRRAEHDMPDGGLAFRWRRETQGTGLSWP